MHNTCTNKNIRKSTQTLQEVSAESVLVEGVAGEALVGVADVEVSLAEKTVKA